MLVAATILRRGIVFSLMDNFGGLHHFSLHYLNCTMA